MNMHVQPDVSGAASPCLPALDTELANKHLMKLIAVSDLAEDVGTLERASEENLRSHLRLISSMIADTTCDLLDMIGVEEHRQDEKPDSEKD